MKMKKMIVFLECALVVGVIAFGVHANATNKNEDATNMKAQTNSVEVLADTLIEKKNANSTNVSNVSVTASESTEDEEETKQEFTAWAQDFGTYGFLLSEYDDPANADFTEVFYCGAGIGITNNGKHDEDYEDPAVIKYLQDNYCETDSSIIYKSDIDTFLSQKIGLTSDQVNYNFDWIETSKGKAMIIIHGDTNYSSFNCTGVSKDGDIYTLNFEPAGMYEPGYSIVRTMKVKDTGNGSYQILSNHFD